MADTNEQVNYSYTGDVNSLKKATKDAIGFLDQFQAEITRLSELDAFGSNTRASTSFQTALKRTTKVVTQLESKLQAIGEIKTPSYTSDIQSTFAGLSNVSNVFKKIQSSTQLTTKDVRGLTAQLKNAKTEIQSNSVNVETLVNKEIKFQNTLTSLQNGSRKLRDSLDTLKSSISNTFGSLTTKLNSLQNPFAKIITPLQVYKSKAAEAFGRITQMAQAVVSAFRRVQQSEDGAANSASRNSNAHKKLSSTVTSIAKSVDKETSQLKKETDTLKTKDKQVNRSTTHHSRFNSVIISIINVINREVSGLKRLSLSFKNVIPSITGSNNVLSKFKNLIVSLGLVEAANQSIKFAENLNLFNVAMGSAADKGREYIKQMQEIYGMDPSNLLRYAGNFYQLADAIQMPDDAAVNLSLSLTKATNDIASLFNVDVETVFENLSSGMQGMSRAVRKYGMDIRSVTLQQTALNYGITENVDNMSEANRQALRFITMMEQAKNATTQLVEGVDGTTQTMGDFANTIEQPANQLRIFKEQLSQLGRAIGDLFIVPLRNALQYINGFIMALRVAITFIGALVGAISDVGGSGKSLDNTAEGIGSIGSAAAGAAKELKKFLAPFDELNVMQSQQSTGGGGGGSVDLGTLDPKLQDAIANMSFDLEDVRMKANEVRDALLSFFGFKVNAGEIISWDSSAFEANLIKKFPKWTQTIQATFDNWSGIVEGFKSVMNSLGVVAEKVWGKVSGFVGKFVNDETASNTISNLDESLKNLAKTIEDKSDIIAEFLISLPFVLTGFKGLSAISETILSLSVSFSLLSTSCGSLLTTLAPIAGWITAIAAAIVLLYTNSETFATEFDSLLVSVWTGMQPTLTSLLSLFTTIWTSLQTLWEEHVQPMLEKTGEALAPVLETISKLWQDVNTITAGVNDSLEKAWTQVIEPVFSGICDIVGDVMDIFQKLWEEFLGPIIEKISTTLTNLWVSYIKPIVDKITQIIGNVIDILMYLWHTTLAPLVKFLVDVLAPVFTAVFQAIWGVVEFVLGLIFNIIDTLLGVFDGVIEFLVGVFTGDWNKAISGLGNVFVSLGNFIIGIFESMANISISIINTFLRLVVGGVKGLVNGIGDLIEGVARVVGLNLDVNINWSVPQIPKQSWSRIPRVALASGGIVTSPTYAMIGEGRYDEAVIPLGNSPQMQELVGQIAEAVKGEGGSGDMVPVQVYMDGDLFFETMARKNRAATIRTGVNPMMGG